MLIIVLNGSQSSLNGMYSLCFEREMVIVDGRSCILIASLSVYIWSSECEAWELDRLMTMTTRYMIALNPRVALASSAHKLLALFIHKASAFLFYSFFSPHRSLKIRLVLLNLKRREEKREREKKNTRFSFSIGGGNISGRDMKSKPEKLCSLCARSQLVVVSSELPNNKYFCSDSSRID